MKNNLNKTPTSVVASWSGGVDSTAVLAQLLANGYDVQAVHVNLYEHLTPSYAAREAAARRTLLPALRRVADTFGTVLLYEEADGRWIDNFTLPNSLAMPQRNKRVIDFLMARYVIPQGVRNLAMGEYIGVDTWVVSDHVPPTDCDHRALSAYLYHEYGLDFRFLSLADFGESRYKHNRVALGYQYLGLHMSETTNCMADEEVDCGECYKCAERAAAFKTAEIPDLTPYRKNPAQHEAFEVYLRQMRGERVSMPYNLFPQHQ